MRRWRVMFGLVATCALLLAAGAARTGPRPSPRQIDPWTVLNDIDRLARVGLAGKPADRVAYLRRLAVIPSPQTVEKALDLIASEDFASREEGERLLSGAPVAAVIASKPQRDAETKARLDRCAEAWNARADPLLMGAIARSLVLDPAPGAADAIRIALAVCCVSVEAPLFLRPESTFITASKPEGTRSILRMPSTSGVIEYTASAADPTAHAGV